MIGIFIEPQKELKHYIEKWKENVQQSFNHSKLTSHPSHSTIYYSDISFNKDTLKELSEILKKIKPFKIIANKNDVFSDDKLAGGDTIYIAIRKNRKLHKLQEQIAEKLKLFLNKKKLTKKNVILKNKILLKSFKKYGYPFVGNHWKPHFTISSVKNGNNSDTFKNFIKEKIKFENRVEYISVWRISGNQHNLIKKIRLKN
jgi:2'-5' RNA ligase